MTDIIAPPVPPSKRQLLKATLIALVVAAVVLVTVVLPAEYGIDPLGTGSALGLVMIAESTVTPVAAASGGPIAARSSGYKVDAIEFVLFPGDSVEYKYHLDTGATMLYSWKASAPLEFDMHTEPDGKPPEASDSFEAGTKNEGYGSYVAPYAGIHGWYWKNPGTDGNITITLTTAGFYTVAKMFAGSPEGEEMPVSDPPPPPTF